MLINRENCLLLVVDVQQKLIVSIPEFELIVAAVKRLIDAATLLNLPICATEHCPANIGATIGLLRDSLLDGQIIEKVHFSAYLEKSFQDRLHKLQPQQIIVCGVEAHVCVLQTALMLQANGYDTFLVSDASASRRSSDSDAALLRATQEGVRVVSSEMVLFEWLRRADVPEFRDVLTLIKSRQ